MMVPVVSHSAVPQVGSLLSARQCSHAFTSGRPGPPVQRKALICRADGDGDGLTDRLKAAEAEAEALRKQLAAARAAQAEVRSDVVLHNVITQLSTNPYSPHSLRLLAWKI